MIADNVNFYCKMTNCGFSDPLNAKKGILHLAVPHEGSVWNLTQPAPVQPYERANLGAKYTHRRVASEPAVRRINRRAL